MFQCLWNDLMYEPENIIIVNWTEKKKEASYWIK